MKSFSLFDHVLKEPANEKLLCLFSVGSHHIIMWLYFSWKSITQYTYYSSEYTIYSNLHYALVPKIFVLSISCVTCYKHAAPFSWVEVFLGQHKLSNLVSNINFIQKPLEVRAQSGFRLCADRSGRVQKQSMCFMQTDLAHL